MSSKVKYRILPDVVLEINMNVLESGKSKVENPKDEEEFTKKDSFKQEVKIENISYKRPDHNEMIQYWEDFVRSRKELQRGNMDNDSAKANYDFNKAVNDEYRKMRREIVRAYFGVIGLAYLKSLESEHWNDNSSSLTLSDSEANDLVRKISMRLKDIDPLENIHDFYSKTNNALKDMDYYILPIENKLTRRTICFIHNLDKKREKEYSYKDFDFSNYKVKANLDLEDFNNYFSNKYFKGKKLSVAKEKIKKYFNKKYGENKYSLYEVNIETIWKKDVDIFLIKDIPHTRKTKSGSFVEPFIIMIKYRKSDDERFEKLYIKSVKMRRISSYKELLFKTIKKDILVKSNKGKDIKFESFENKVDNMLLEYFLR